MDIKLQNIKINLFGSLFYAILKSISWLVDDLNYNYYKISKTMKKMKYF